MNPWTSCKEHMRRYVVRNRRSLILRKLAQYCRTYIGFYENRHYDIAENGEVAVLDSLCGFDMRTIFDVGAHTGNWAAAAIERFPHASIHCFEIVDETAATLERRFDGNARLIVNREGLSDESGATNVRTYEGRSDIATLYSYPEQKEACVIRGAEVIRGDEYIVSRQIERIDFLKLDVEGAELKVLKGLERALAAGIVSIIQFEYGMVNIVAGFFLRDLYALLCSAGFAIGKIFPTYVDFRPYNLAAEDFHGPNYLAVRSDRPDLIERVRTLGEGTRSK